MEDVGDFAEVSPPPSGHRTTNCLLSQKSGYTLLLNVSILAPLGDLDSHPSAYGKQVLICT